MSPRKRTRKGKQRDYRREYQRRIERGKERGYDLSVARGHSRSGLLGIRVANSLHVPPGTAINDITVRETGRTVTNEQQEGIKETLSKLFGLQAQQLEVVDWDSEQAIIKYLLDLGFTSREAYTLRFSP